MATVRVGLEVVREIAALNAATTTALRAKYAELFKEQPRSNNRSYLFKRLALKVQELGRAGALGKKGVVEAKLPADAAVKSGVVRDARLPAVGTILTKSFRGREIRVLVRDRDFEYEGERFKSLSAIAKHVSGCNWNGYGFFNLMPSAKETA